MYSAGYLTTLWLILCITLPTNPLDFVPRQRFTQECANALDLDLAQWLWPEEVKLVWWMVLNH